MFSALHGVVPEEDSSTLGSLVETAVFSQMMHDPDRMDSIFYVRFKQGRGEVDLVSLDPNYSAGGLCIEIKWSDKHYSNPASSLKNLVDFCGNNSIQTAFVTTHTIELEKCEIRGVKIVFYSAAYLTFYLGYQIIKGKDKQLLQKPE